MSGHNKWANIKHRKGAADAKKGKVFSRHAKLITIAAKNGGDPSVNPSLALAIERARAENMPNANIERAIKSGTGELKEGAEILENTYEGFGPEKISVIVTCLTDNKQRTVSNLRHLFEKFGGSLGATGAVSWKFKRAGLITLAKPPVWNEELELKIIECGADDLKMREEELEVITTPDTLLTVKKELEQQGFKVEDSSIAYLANEEKLVTDLAEAQKIVKFLDALDEDDDVNEVFSDINIDSTILNQL